LSTALAQVPLLTRRACSTSGIRLGIFGFCLSRLGSREEAEDALPDDVPQCATRVSVAASFPITSSPGSSRLRENVCHNRHQSARRRGRVEGTQDLDALQDVLASPERGSPVSLADLTRALSAVPTDNRRALLLREFQGLSYEEIGVELGVSVAAVETLIFRARRSVAASSDVSRRSRPVAAPSPPSPSSSAGSSGRGHPGQARRRGCSRCDDRDACRCACRSAAADAAARRVDACDGDEARACGQASSARGAHDVRPAFDAQTSTESLTPSAPVVNAGSTPIGSVPPTRVPPVASTPAATQPVLPLPLPVSVPDVVNAPTLTVPVVDPGLSLPAVTLPGIQVTLPLIPAVPPNLP